MSRRLITVADDFGLTLGVNEAVELAAKDGILTTASLMVAGAAADDAVRRAKKLPALRVGLHLVTVEGPPVLPRRAIPALVGADGMFPADQLRLGLRYAFHPAARRQLAAEIRAQFVAFQATGLRLDHANAHKHMHLHPVVGNLMIRIGREFGLRAIRVPAELPGPGASFGAHMLHWWCGILRGQARRAGLVSNDRIFGLADTGHMKAARVAAILDALPPGLSEMYFHPATSRNALLRRLMPAYEHEAELNALMSCTLPSGIALTTYDRL